MPPSHRPSTTTLYLPPVKGDEGASSSPNTPSLEVLLMAQQIAQSRGHSFDIDSFLLPDQRDEYVALLARGGDGADGASVASGSGSAQDEAPTEAEESEADNGDGEDSEERPSKRARVQGSHPTPLAQQYWRQRMERLAHIQRRSATPRVKNEPEEPGTPVITSAPHTPGPSTPLRHHHHHAKEDKPPTPAEKANIQQSASYWNNLLIQARAQRGPQWEYNTQLYQVDRFRPEYYTQGRPPPPTPPPRSPKPLPPVADASKGKPELPNGGVSAANGDPPSSSAPSTTAPIATPSAAPSSTPAQQQRPTPAIVTNSSQDSGAAGAAGQPGRFPFAQPGASPATPQSGPGGYSNFNAPGAQASPSPHQQPPHNLAHLPPQLRLAQAQAHAQAQAAQQAQLQAAQQAAQQRAQQMPQGGNPQAQALAAAQAQALALGQQEGAFHNLNPGMLHMQQQPGSHPGMQGGGGGPGGPPGGPAGGGINPMMMGMGGGGMPPGMMMGGMQGQFQGGQGPMLAGAGGQGPMLGGGWGGEASFTS